MIELENNLSSEYLKKYLNIKKRSGFNFRCFFLTIMMLIYIKMFVVLDEPVSIFFYTFTISLSIFCLLLLFREYKEANIKETIYKNGTSHNLVKIQFTKEKIKIFFSDHTCCIYINKYTNTSNFVLSKDDNVIFISINTVFMLSLNNMDEEQWSNLENLFHYYKNNEHVCSLQNDDELFQCKLLNTRFKHLLYIIQDKIRTYTNIRRFDIIILILSIIDIFTIRLHIYTILILRLVIFLMYAIHKANIRHLYDMKSGYIDQKTKIKFTPNHYTIIVDNKVISRGDIDNIFKIEKLKNFYYIQTVSDRLFIQNQDYYVLKRIIERIDVNK